MLIRNAKVFMPDGRFRCCDLRFTEHIAECGHFPDENGLDAAGRYVVPGFIDIHTHGVMGGDFSDGAAADIPAMARYYAAHGVSCFLAAAMTLPVDALCRAAETVRDYVPAADAAACAGLFMEGPFLSAGKRGAQCEKWLRAPDTALFERVDAASGHRVRMVTVAPETPGALPFIRQTAKRCTVALGHTAADYDAAREAFSAGATVLTHLYNGMNELQHRAPGPIGAGMDAGAYAELICDGLHVHPAAVRAAFRLFPSHIVLVSDSLRCTGMPDGLYSLGGQSVTLKSGRCTLTGSDTLAGSAVTLHGALVNAVRFGIPLAEAVAAATHNPARAVGLDGERGFLLPGLAADFVLLEPDLSIHSVWLRGKPLGGHIIG